MNDHYKSKDYQNSIDSEIEKNGFPVSLKLFWAAVGILWLFKIISFALYELPNHIALRNEINIIEKLKQNHRYHETLSIHEKLIAKCPSYKESYYFDIAQCYLACGEINGNFKKGLELLIDKQLSEINFLTLQKVVPFSQKELFDSLFLVYINKKSGEKTYMFDYENLGL